MIFLGFVFVIFVWEWDSIDGFDGSMDFCVCVCNNNLKLQGYPQKLSVLVILPCHQFQLRTLVVAFHCVVIISLSLLLLFVFVTEITLYDDFD